MRIICLITVLCMTIVVIQSSQDETDQLPECTETDFHYEYTACDSDGGRWRVSVPNPSTCVGGKPPAPARGQSCDFTCEPGEYLDIATDQECHPCAAGRFSLGGGVLYNTWNTIPQGFRAKSEGFSEDEEDCTEESWKPSGKYITTTNTDCVATLVYSANLVRTGSVTFVYRYIEGETIETMFTLEIENGHCETKSRRNGVKYLDTTDSDEWKSLTYPLNAGVNILSWRLYSIAESVSTRMKRFIAIQSVEIKGVAFTSNCTECEEGTFSSAGASICEPCPANTYSKRGAKNCIACDEKTQYSASGSSECYTKPPCTEEHYIMYFTPCHSGKTQKKFQWIEPKLCLDGVALPKDGDLEPCPPCNVGMQLLDGSCQFCEANEFSDGLTECQPCPGSTTPETAVVLKQWSNLPKNANITLRCMSLREAGEAKGCMSELGWAMSNDYIKTVSVNADDVYSVLSIDIAGFRSSPGGNYNPDVSAEANAEVSFLFEMVCSDNCEFMFFMQKGAEKTQLVEMWSNKQPKVAYRLPIRTELPVKFSWAYRKSATSSRFSFINDYAKIYMVNITNTLSGGAATCKQCPQGTTGSGCIPCPAGQYINSEHMKCEKCPEGTVIYSGLSWGVDSCVKCGPGLVPFKGQRCISHCTYQSPDQKTYNFTELARNIIVQGPRLFTQTGHAYFHQFNISLCGNDEEFELAYCNHNMTSSSSVVSRSEVSVKANVCQRTILLSQDHSEPIVSVSPISLGSSLVSITNVADANITRLISEAGFQSEKLNETQEIYMKYSSETPTAACRLGRTVTIVLHCTADKQDTVTAELPPKCADGTCDGCNFIFMVKSPLACPICKQEDIETYTTPCVDGKLSTIKKTKLPCNEKGSNVVLTRIESPCNAYWLDQWPMWVKVVIILVPVVLISGVLLLIVVISCWIKNRNLEYKYMKLIESSSGNDSEMPAPEVCGLDEGEDEEEHFDAIKIRKGAKFFSKFKVAQKRGANKSINSDGDEDDDSFESMRMTDKTSLT